MSNCKKVICCLMIGMLSFSLVACLDSNKHGATMSNLDLKQVTGKKDAENKEENSKDPKEKKEENKNKTP